MQGRKYKDPPATLDLAPYVGSAADPKSLPDLVDELQRLRQELGKWTDGQRGLLVYSVDRDRYVARRDRPHWRETARQTLEQKGWLAYFRWLRDRQLARYGWGRLW